MADSESILAKPLKPKVEDLSVLDQITHLGKQFTKDEKKEFFNSLPGKKYKVGLIRNKELDITIKIFTESFDFSKKLRPSLGGTDSFVSKECRYETSANAKPEESDMNTNTNSVTSTNATVNSSESLDDLETIPLEGFNASGNIGSDPKELPHAPETIGTSSDFERLYLGWMNNPSEPLGEEEKQTKKNVLKSLFRFVFGTKNISDVTATTLQKKMRIAYTPLTPEEKVPCYDSRIWDDFRKSLVYRRRIAMCELYAARDVLGGEQRLYIERKKTLILGLRDLIDTLDRDVYPCMLYAYDGSQHEDETVIMKDEEFSRILKVFRTFIKDKKEGRDYYSLKNLQKELSKPGKEKEVSDVLYQELLALLTWMEGEAEAQAKMTVLETQIEELQSLTSEQKGTIEELETLVLLLTVLLAMAEKIHKLQLALAELKCQLESCCDHKKTLRVARKLLNVKKTDIETLEKEIQKTTEEFEALVGKLKKTIGVQTQEIQELEEILLALTKVLISIEKVHTLKLSVSELQASVKECCEKKKQVETYKKQLENIKQSLLQKNQSAQTVAANSMVDQGIQFANQADSELEKQITELKKRIEEIVNENKELKNTVFLKDVLIKELEAAETQLTSILLAMRDKNKIDKDIQSLKAAIELCCERKKSARKLKEEMERLERQIQDLLTKEKTEALEKALQTAQEGKKKAEDIIVGVSGEIEDLKGKLESVVEESKADLAVLRNTIEKKNKKNMDRNSELASKISELEGNILSSEKVLKDVEESNQETPQKLLENQETPETSNTDLKLLENQETPQKLLTIEERLPQPSTSLPKQRIKRLVEKRPAWRGTSSPSQYTGRAAMGVSGARPGTTGAEKVGVRQRGGKGGIGFCDTMLTLLLLEMSKRDDMNVEEFLNKANTTIDELGQCPLVLRSLSDLLEEATATHIPEEGYLFTPSKSSSFASELQTAYEKGFTDAEKESLLHTAPPILYYTKSPEEFESVLGSEPYFLNGYEKEGEDVRLQGVDLDSDEEPLIMTSDERKYVEQGGVPLGAILILYLTAAIREEDSEQE